MIFLSVYLNILLIYGAAFIVAIKDEVGAYQIVNKRSFSRNRDRNGYTYD